MILGLKIAQEVLNFFFDWHDWYYIFDILLITSICIVIFFLFKNIYFYSHELNEKDSFLKIIVENMKAGIVVTDSDGNITFINEPLAKSWKISNLKYPIPLEEWLENVNQYRLDGTLIDKNEIPLAHVLSGKEVTNVEYLVKEEGSHLQYQLANGRIMLDKSGESVGAIMVVNDITDLKEAELKINHMAYHDSLTGLPNRELFNKSLVPKINLAKHNNRKYSVMFLDLDGFKMVNDSFGHEMGDYLLKQVGNRLISCLRPDDLIARQGGDEFIILLNEATVNDTNKIADTILKTISYPFILGGKEIVISTSIGIGTYPLHGKDADTLTMNAETAMYQSKENGKNNYFYYHSGLDETDINRLSMANSLRKALENQELELYYQPKINFSLNRMVGVEALLRWKNPEFGMVSPADFIPLAEETGLIVEIGEWVLRTAVEQNKKWQDSGFSPVTVSVNLSARQFLQDDLVNKIERILYKTGLHPSYLKLEITETMAMHNLNQSITTLEQLKSLGIGLSLDDFGTGFSSLSYLKKFPINELKIDQSFIRNVVSDTPDASIVKAIISIAKSLNLTVVAEGVETEKHVEFLQQHQCDEAQGYYFSKPVPSNEIENFLNRI